MSGQKKHGERLQKLEQTIWGDGYCDKGLAGDAKSNDKRIKRLENAYTFGLGSMATINFIIGIYSIFKGIK